MLTGSMWRIEWFEAGERFRYIIQLTHSNGGNGKNPSIVKENEIRKISPPDKVKPLKDESERALDLKMTPLGNGAATSLNNHLGGANNDPIASTLRSLGSSVQDSVTQHPCRQTKSNRPLLTTAMYPLVLFRLLKLSELALDLHHHVLTILTFQTLI